MLRGLFRKLGKSSTSDGNRRVAIGQVLDKEELQEPDLRVTRLYSMMVMSRMVQIANWMQSTTPGTDVFPAILSLQALEDLMYGKTPGDHDRMNLLAEHYGANTRGILEARKGELAQELAEELENAGEAQAAELLRSDIDGFMLLQKRGHAIRDACVRRNGL